MQSFISGQPSVQGDNECIASPQTTEMVEFGWNQIKVSSKVPDPINMSQIEGSLPSTRNCHSSTQFGQYLIVFGGREGDGKKRIVNDIFIFDTEK